MSDMKLYKILETFDELESATDKLTPVTEEDVNEPAKCPECKGTGEVDGETCAECDGGGYDKDSDFSKFDESQTKVQTMGNKVKVTTDGDTTEFDDAETAKAMMGGADEDENSFATESEEADAEQQWALELNGKLYGVGSKSELEAHQKEHGPASATIKKHGNKGAKVIEEGGLGGDMWDSAADDLEFGGEDPYEMPPEMGALEIPVDDFDADDYSGLDLEEDADESEFATFDCENESHRKRLQRGTPVVLDPELFSDPDVDRRGVFVSRSPGGDFAKVVRDFDGKEIKVHLSDIKSADLVNNSVYEEYEINLEAMLAEDITMTQTTNMEQPENDTTTVTAVGAEAGEELAAMMANAGLNTGGYDSMDAPVASDHEMVDTGEPEEIAPAEMPMQDMMSMMDAPAEPETMEGRDDDLPPMYTPDDEGDAEPSNADLDQIDMDNEFDLDFEMDESVGSTTEVEKILTKFDDRDIREWLQDGNDAVDEALMMISMEDMPYGTQKARTGDPSEWLYDRYGEEIAMYAADNFGRALGEEHANTPNELEMGVDMITHGTSGGLNRPKTMHKPAAGGDNAMQRPIKETDADRPAVRDRVQGMLNAPDETDDNQPSLKRRAQSSERYLRSKHGMSKEPGETSRDMYAMYDDEMTEELSPENQKKQDALLAKAKAERDWSTSSKGSRLTGKGRGTGSYDRSIRTEYESVEQDAEIVEGADQDTDQSECSDCGELYDPSMDSCPSCEDKDNKLVNEHESVDNFLNMYKEFRIRTDKK